MYWRMVMNFVVLHLLQVNGESDNGLRKSCAYIDYLGREEQVIENPRINFVICNKTFTISHVEFPPYSHYHIIEYILEKCCSNITKFDVVNNFPDVSNLSVSGAISSHFIYPILGRASASSIYGYYFIPYIDVQSTYYITTSNGVHERLLKSCLELYPLIIISLLLALMAGFVAWTIETWSNKDQFPRPFLIGWSEGFWWSFVSMTTVGYGDKTPKSVIGRIFSVCWILIGIILFNVITGTITSNIWDIEFQSPPKIEGSVVGTLKYRTYDSSVIAKKGGILHETKTTGIHEGVFELINKLRHKEINGFLLDKYSFWYISVAMRNISMMDKFENRQVDIDFFQTKTIRTEKIYEGEKLSYGILVKDKDDYDYFKDIIMDNRLIVETRLSLLWNSAKEKLGSTKHHASAHEGYYLVAMKLFGIVLGVLFILGLAYELIRKWSGIKLVSPRGHSHPT